MYDELVKRLRNGLPCYGEKCLSCSDRKHCITHYEHEAADAIEAQNIHILTLQYEMMAEAESHIAEMNRLNKHIEVISKMENTTRWIPVTERLPERFKSVLTIDKYSVITFNWISGDGKNWSTGYYITHWMPLPEPPKEE